MRKKAFSKSDMSSNGLTAALIIMAVVFFVGSLAGCILAGRAEGEGEAALSGYLDSFLNIAISGEMTKPSFFVLLWKALRWPLFVFLCGFTPLGLIGIPVLFLARAFLLSFSISSFFRVLGAKGLLFAFSVFGLSGLIYIPILFVFGIQGFLNAGSLIGRITGESKRYTNLNRLDLIRYCVCFLFLLLCSLFEFSLGNSILKTAAEMFI